MNDLISVIMSTYREREDHLRLAVESILQQTYKNIEFIIVVDDPNNNSLIQILNEYKENDTRVKLLINEKNIGPSLSRNKGYSIASGSYVAIMDADDISKKDRIKIQYNYMLMHPNVGAVFSTRDIINEDSVVCGKTERHISSNQIREALKFGNILTNPTAFLRKTAINGMLYRDITYAEDYDLWLRLITYSVEIAELPLPLLSYRIRENSLSHANYAKVWVGSQYSRNLFKQRIHKNSDCYSKSDFINYLRKSIVRNSRRMKRFNKSYNLYNKALELIKAHNYIIGIAQLINSVIVDVKILSVIYLAYKTRRCLK